MVYASTIARDWMRMETRDVQITILSLKYSTSVDEKVNHTVLYRSKNPLKG